MDALSPPIFTFKLHTGTLAAILGTFLTLTTHTYFNDEILIAHTGELMFEH